MRQKSGSISLPRKPVLSKKTELSVVIRQRDALWALLSDIDASEVSEHVRTQLRRRFDIYNPGE